MKLKEPTITKLFNFNTTFVKVQVLGITINYNFIKYFNTTFVKVQERGQFIKRRSIWISIQLLLRFKEAFRMGSAKSTGYFNTTFVKVQVKIFGIA